MAVYALGERTPSIDPDAFVHPEAVVIGAVSIAILVVLKKRAPKLPRALIVVAGTTVAVWAFDLASAGVAIVGEMARDFRDDINDFEVAWRSSAAYSGSGTGGEEGKRGEWSGRRDTKTTTSDETGRSRRQGRR